MPQLKLSPEAHSILQGLPPQPAEADVPRKSIESDVSIDTDPRSTRQPSKKRKSIIADDIYRPPLETDDEDLEPVKKRTPPKKKARKLGKTTEELPSTSDFKKTEPQSQRNAAGRFLPAKKPGALPNKLTKAPRKPTPTQQSVSSPSSDFKGLEYPKPMTSPDREKTKNVLQDDVEPYSAVPGTGSDVPPMPKLPKAVRLPSGEIVNTAETGKAKENEPCRGGSLKNSETQKRARSKQSFEWERDTF